MDQRFFRDLDPEIMGRVTSRIRPFAARTSRVSAGPEMATDPYTWIGAESGRALIVTMESNRGPLNLHQ